MTAAGFFVSLVLLTAYEARRLRRQARGRDLLVCAVLAAVAGAAGTFYFLAPLGFGVVDLWMR